MTKEYCRDIIKKALKFLSRGGTAWKFAPGAERRSLRAAFAAVSSASSSRTLGISADSYRTLLLFETLVAVLILAFGIAGIIFAAKKEKAQTVVAFGGILIVLRIVDLVWAMSVMGDKLNPSIILGVILGCVLPLLYIIGGNKRKNAPM